MRNVWVGLALSAGAILLAGCQTPQASTAAKPQQQASADLQSGKICKSVETTGSRFTTKECHTAAEWAQLRGQGADQLEIQNPNHEVMSK